jgi:type I restriction enzyme S subunit
MMTSRVSTSALCHRLDCPFYHPEALRLDHRLNEIGNSRALSEVIDSSRTITNGVRGPVLQSSDYRLVRLQDCDGWFVRFDTCLTISEQQFRQNRRCQLRKNDIIVAIGGYIGHAAIVCEVKPAVIGQHSALIPLPENGELDPHYLTTYLNADTGRIQLQRCVSGTVQTGVNLEDLRDVRIPVFTSSSQRYIGDKVRLAERLRQISRVRSTYALRLVNAFLADEESAVNLEHTISKLLNGEVLADEHSQQIESKSARQSNPGGKSSRISKDFLTTRLDCNFYNRDALELDMRFAKGYEVATFGDVIDQSRQITNGVRGPDIQPSMFKLVRLQDFAGWSIDFDSCLTISEAQFRENRRCQLQEGDVIVAIGGYIGHAAMARRVQTAVIGQHSAVLPMGSNSKVDEGFLVAFLSSNAGAVQLQRYVSGTVQAGINLEDLTPISAERNAATIWDETAQFLPRKSDDLRQQG